MYMPDFSPATANNADHVGELPADYLTMPEAAELLGCATADVQQLVIAGRLQIYFAGPCLMIPRAELLAMVSASTF